MPKEQAGTPRRRTLWLAGLVLLQALVLGWITVSYYAISWYGQEIRVKTAPVDPRDLLYGDYVSLRYDMSRVPLSLWKDDKTKAERNKVIYVALKPDGNGYYSVAGAYATKPELAEGEVVIRGHIEYVMPADIEVDYGIEKYYVKENTGKALEQKAANLTARLKVSSSGQAKIEALEERS